LKFICGDSEKAKKLRKLIIIKVIPMINPDGVIIGNFRTSFCGKDLNRVFK
jgi:murein tripeptide amidase MpaA